MPNEKILEVRGLGLTYASGTRAVDEVNFSIHRGQTLGLVGESGSGKSSVAQLILGLRQPSEGSITLLGTEITSLGHRAMRAMRPHAQLVMQDPVSALNRRKTIEQIIGLPLRSHTDMSAAQQRARITELLDLVQLPESAMKRRPRELSGGQCQRVGIARALALSPEFLILDESVSAIDVVVQAQILNLLKSLQSELGLTYLFISHDLAVVRYMADEIVVMQGGRVVETGSRDDVFARPKDPYTISLIESAPSSLASKRLESENTTTVFE